MALTDAVDQKLAFLLEILRSPSWFLVLTHHTDIAKIRSWLDKSAEPDEASVYKIDQLHSAAIAAENRLRLSGAQKSHVQSRLLRTLVITISEEDQRTIVEMIADDDIEAVKRRIDSIN